MKLVKAAATKGRAFLMVAFVATLMALASVLPAQAQAPVYTVPSVDGFSTTMSDVQTFTLALVTGPGRGAIYAMLAIAAFRFVYRMVNKSTSPK
jgi:hypothetical protein